MATRPNPAKKPAPPGNARSPVFRQLDGEAVPISVQKLIEDTNDLPVMPAPILRVMHLAGEPNSSASQLAEAICAEPSLAGRVLRFANSAYYGMAGQVTTIQGAVVLLGIRTVRNLAMVAASHAWFGAEDDNPIQKGLWDHAIGVAAASDAIATLRAPELANEAFCSGLLHDLGKSVLAIRLGDKFKVILEKAAAQNLPPFEVEKTLLGFDHAEIGQALAAKWNLPQRLQEPLRYHHEPNLLQPTSTLVDIVHVADVLYWSSIHTGPPVTTKRCEDAFTRLGFEEVGSYEALVKTMLHHQQQLERLMTAA